jgi:type IV pilus assembly protein PilF
LAIAIILAALAGCAAQVADGQNRDRVTASDQTDADRRARLRMELASGYYSRGQLETALDEVKQALAVRPDLPEAYNLRALIYEGLGDDRLAEDSYKHALQLKPATPTRCTTTAGSSASTSASTSRSAGSGKRSRCRNTRGCRAA